MGVVPGGGSVTCAGCLIVDPLPTIGGVSPSSRQHGTATTLTISGTGFQSNAVVSFSGSGIHVDSVSGSSTSLSVHVTITTGAGRTTRDVTVTNPDGGAATKKDAFRVT